MLRTLLFLLSFITDNEFMADIAHNAFLLGVIDASVLVCVGAFLAARYGLTSRRTSNATLQQFD